jgi:hypothetical protein
MPDTCEGTTECCHALSSGVQVQRRRPGNVIGKALVYKALRERLVPAQQFEESHDKRSIPFNGHVIAPRGLSLAPADLYTPGHAGAQVETRLTEDKDHREGRCVADGRARLQADADYRRLDRIVWIGLQCDNSALPAIDLCQVSLAQIGRVELEMVRVK